MLKKKLLIIGHIFPESKATAAGWRMLKLIDTFKDRYEVFFATAAQRSENSDDLAQVDHVLHFPLNEDSVSEQLVSINPDVVIFDRFYTEEMFGWRVAEVIPNAHRVLNSEDLHFLRLSREKWVNEHKVVAPLNLAGDYRKDVTTREIASILRCHTSLIISRVEMDLLINEFKIPSHKLAFLPLQLPQSNFNFTGIKQDFCFIGNGIHKPNADAITWLVKEIWPIIQKRLPQAKLNIACGYTTSVLRQLLAKKKNIQLHERVEDASLFVQQHKVQLMPIRFGAGIKGKVLESIVNQTPFVCTSIALEGIGTDYSFCSNEIDNFVEKAIELFQQESSYQQAFEEMKAIADDYPSFELHAEKVQGHLEKDVVTDWFAETLLAQQTNATKYLSKYIIEKNRLLAD